MKFVFRVLIFIIINFLGLLIGSAYTGIGARSTWYQELNKAPWNPPGYLFGVFWLFIMICFAFYMSKLYTECKSKKIIVVIFILQWFLNLIWNPIFFYFRNIEIGFIVICCLTFLIFFFLYKYYKVVKLWSIFIFPYFLWLLIASSLNLYVYLYN